MNDNEKYNEFCAAMDNAVEIAGRIAAFVLEGVEPDKYDEDTDSMARHLADAVDPLLENQKSIPTDLVLVEFDEARCISALGIIASYYGFAQARRMKLSHHKPVATDFLIDWLAESIQGDIDAGF